jgi:hypothetical protein
MFKPDSADRSGSIDCSSDAPQNDMTTGSLPGSPAISSGDVAGSVEGQIDESSPLQPSLDHQLSQSGMPGRFLLPCERPS